MRHHTSYKTQQAGNSPLSLQQPATVCASSRQSLATAVVHSCTCMEEREMLPGATRLCHRYTTQWVVLQ